MAKVIATQNKLLRDKGNGESDLDQIASLMLSMRNSKQQEALFPSCSKQSNIAIVPSLTGPVVPSVTLCTNPSLSVPVQRFHPYKKIETVVVPPSTLKVDSSGPVVGKAKTEKPHVCTYVLPDQTVCNRAFNKLVHLKAHIRTHTGERPFVCTYEDCKKSFTQLATLKNHLATHKKDKPFPCTQCNRTFARRSALAQHEQTHLGEGRQVFVCTMEGCEKVFTQQSSLRAHLRIHSGEKPFICPVESCRRAFSRRSNLKRHVATHPAELQNSISMQSSPSEGQSSGSDDEESQVSSAHV